mmetsp:Transcript_26096/g.66259  ORF Transcript_26096/g.66259 Transcript_26096/m.66259 type:complete len:86 (-) Transcript_26096:1115-1372(-)
MSKRKAKGQRNALPWHLPPPKQGGHTDVLTWMDCERFWFTLSDSGDAIPFGLGYTRARPAFPEDAMPAAPASAPVPTLSSSSVAF